MGHVPDRVRDNLGRSAAPTCVHRTNGVPARIEKQYRDAIGGSNPDALADLVRDERVTLLLSILQSMGIPHAIGMDLAQGDVDLRIGLTRTEAVVLPFDLVESLATINAVGSEAE